MDHSPFFFVSYISFFHQKQCVRLVEREGERNVDQVVLGIHFPEMGILFSIRRD